MTHATLTITNSHFRGYNDTAGGYSSPIAAEDTNFNVQQGDQLWVQICMQETAGGASNNVAFQWQYSLNGGTWTDITTTSSVIRAFNSQWVTDGTSTTQQLSGTGTFITDNAGVTETGTVTGTADYAGNDNTETMCVLQVQTGLSALDEIELRVLYNATAPAGTPVLPLLTVLVNRDVTQNATAANTLTVNGALVQRPVKLEWKQGFAGTAAEIITTYVDASVSGPTDVGNSWSNDANAFDGSESTFATSTTINDELQAYGLEYDFTGKDITSLRFDALGSEVSGTLLVTARSTPLGFTYNAFSFNGDTWTGWEDVAIMPNTRDTDMMTPADLDDIQWSYEEFAVTTVYAHIIKVEVTCGENFTYYFNGTWSDPDSAWSGEDNLVDGDIATDAAVSLAGSTSFRVLIVDGTSSPATGNNEIQEVYARVYGDDYGNLANINVEIWSTIQSELLGTVYHTNNDNQNAYGFWDVLTPPTGGWTWAELAALQSRSYIGNGQNAVHGISRIEIYVTTYPPAAGANATITFEPKIQAATAEMALTESSATITFTVDFTATTEKLRLTINAAGVSPRVVQGQTEPMHWITRSPATMFHLALVRNYGRDSTTSYITWNSYSTNWANQANLIDGDENTYGYYTQNGDVFTGTYDMDIRGSDWSASWVDADWGKYTLTNEQASSIVFAEFRAKGYISNGTGTLKITAGGSNSSGGYDNYATMVTITSTTPVWSEWSRMTGPQYYWTGSYFVEESWANPGSEDYHTYSYSVDSKGWMENLSSPGTTRGNVARVEHRFWGMAGHKLYTFWGNGKPYGEGSSDYTDTDSVWTDEFLINLDSHNGLRQTVGGVQRPRITINSAGSKGVNDLVIRGVDTRGRRPAETISAVWARYAADHSTTGYARMKCEIWTNADGELLDTISSDEDLSHNVASTTEVSDCTPTPYHLLPVPSGGWTWDTLANLRMYIYAEGGDESTAMYSWPGAEFRVAVLNKPGRRRAIINRGAIARKLKVRCSTEVLTLTENNADVSLGGGRIVTGTTEVLTLTENNATVTTNVALNVTGSTEVLTLTENNGTVSFILNVAGTTEVLTLTENNADVITERHVTTATEQIVLTETNATVTTNVPLNVTGTTEVLTLTENNAAVNATRDATTATEVLTLTENNATVAAAKTVTGTTEILTLTENNGTAQLNKTVSSSVESLVLAVAAASLNLSRSAIGSTEALLLTAIPGAVNGERIVGTTVEVTVLAENAAIIGRPRLVNGTTEALAWAQTNATINMARGVVSITEVLTLTEQNAAVSKGRLITTGTEVLTLTEQNANVNAEYSVDALTEPIVLTETAASVNQSRVIAAATEALILTENQASAQLDLTVAGTTEALVLTENNATITANLPRNVVCATEVLTLTAIPGAVNGTRIVGTTVEVTVFAENAAIIGRPRLVNCATEALTLTENNATANSSRDVGASTEQLAVSVNLSTTLLSKVVGCSSEALTLVESNATVAFDRSVAGATEALVLTENNASVGAARGVAGATEQIVLTETNAAIGADRGVAGATEALVLTESNAQVTTGTNLNVNCATEALVLTENAATVDTTQPLVVTCDTEVLVLTENAATAVLNRTVVSSVEQITISTSSSLVSFNRSVVCSTEGITLTEQNATVSTNVPLTVTGATEQIVLTETNAVVGTGKLIVGATEALVFTENAATVTLGGDRIVTCATEALVLVANSALVDLNTPCKPVITLIMEAAFQRLDAFGYSPQPLVLWPGLQLSPPNEGMWLQPRLYPGETDDIVWDNDACVSTTGVFEIRVYFRPGQGQVQPSELADAICCWFPKGTQLGPVRVRKRPWQSPMVTEDSSKLYIAVSVPYKGLT